MFIIFAFLAANGTAELEFPCFSRGPESIPSSAISVKPSSSPPLSISPATESFFFLFFLLPLEAGDGERSEPPQPDGAAGGGPWPAVAAAAAGHELLRAVPAAPGAEQERVQPLLPRLHRRRPLRLLRPRAPRPPRRPDTAFVVPQRDPGVGGGEADRHLARADVRDQQREDRVPQRAAAGQAGQGRHHHLRDLLPEPAGLVPLLLPRMQAGRDAVGPEPDLRHPAEARRRRRVRLRRLVLQPQEAPAAGARPLQRPAGHPVVGRRGQQVPQRADDARDAADQPVPPVQEEGHPPPRPVLRLASLTPAGATHSSSSTLSKLLQAQRVAQV